ncbi:coronin-2B-like isoform X1 [Melanaphis sacchari]|uniref:coronin-2B-like isoform X1 n=1 Tax=Melanaphis sacchari TaxID=742174 RepID=UPI000DC13AB3|nr:coronin-2B-like isoform X1 [Melanaphis sacchari]
MGTLDKHCIGYKIDDVFKSNALVDIRACNKPVVKSLFRGVRSSKFRHVYGSPSKREELYDNIPITRNAHDSNFCAANPKFVAIVTEVAGGGAFVVLPINKTGRLDLNTSKVTGHRGQVLDVKWNPFNDNIIASCSDDCTIKLWYIPDSGLSCNLNEWLIELSGHRRRVGYIEWHPTAENVIASSGFDYLVMLWDAGTGQILNTIDCHPDIVHSLAFNRDGSRLATTCKDKKIRSIDPRSGLVVSEGICHEGSRSCKVIYLDNERLLTTGFSTYSDRQIAIWNHTDLSEPLHRVNIDSSSGILFPYYDYDTRMVYLAGKGDGNIRYYEIVDESPYIHFLNQFISGCPQKGFGMMLKRGCNVSRCEIMRFYKLHTTRNVCEPISMIVPRKSDQYQHDLYPDTAAPVPALSAQEWFNGINKPPVLMSMKTGVPVKTHKPQAFVSNEATRNDTNYRMKFAFLSKETVPDYRPLDMLPEIEKVQKTQVNQNMKFQQIQQKLSNSLVGKFTNTTDENEECNNIKENSNSDILKNEYQMKKAFTRQCEELNMLRKQLAHRDRRIQDLEDLVSTLQSQLKVQRLQ